MSKLFRLLLILCVPFLLMLSSCSAISYPSGGVPAGIFPKPRRRATIVGSPSMDVIRGGSTIEAQPPAEADAILQRYSDTLPPMSLESAFTEEVVTTVWNRHRRWSAAADRQKKKIQLYRSCHLSLMVAGAFLETLAARMSNTKYGWINSIAGGLCLGAAPLVSNTFLSKESKLNWVRCRSTSERIKAEVFLFRAEVPPYDQDNLIQVLVNRVADISETSRDLKLFYVMTQSDGKKPPPKLDRSSYIKYRLDAQIDSFYIPTARRLAKRSSILKSCQVILAAGSAAIGLVGGSAGGAMSTSGAVGTDILKHVGIWGASCATAAAAFGTHIASTRYDDEVMEWSTAAQRLENLYLRLPKSAQAGTKDWSEFVMSCEEVIASNSKHWANSMVSSDGPKKTS